MVPNFSNTSSCFFGATHEFVHIRFNVTGLNAIGLNWLLGATVFSSIILIEACVSMIILILVLLILTLVEGIFVVFESLHVHKYSCRHCFCWGFVPPEMLVTQCCWLSVDHYGNLVEQIQIVYQISSAHHRLDKLGHSGFICCTFHTLVFWQDKVSHDEAKLSHSYDIVVYLTADNLHNSRLHPLTVFLYPWLVRHFLMRLTLSETTHLIWLTIYMTQSRANPWSLRWPEGHFLNMHVGNTKTGKNKLTQTGKTGA